MVDTIYKRIFNVNLMICFIILDKIPNIYNGLLYNPDHSFWDHGNSHIYNNWNQDKPSPGQANMF